MPYDSEHGKLWQDIKADVDKTRSRASKFAAATEWAFGKKTARVLGAVGLFAMVVIFLVLFLHLYIDPGRKGGERKGVILTTAQILGGTALLSGLYST